jgi:hypothetical protein
VGNRLVLVLFASHQTRLWPTELWQEWAPFRPVRRLRKAAATVSVT